MSNPTGTGATAEAQKVTPTSSITSNAPQTKAVATPPQTPSNASDIATETVLLKAKRSFTAAPLQQDVRVVAKGEEFEATPAFADFAIAKKWVTKLDGVNDASVILIDSDNSWTTTN